MSSEDGMGAGEGVNPYATEEEEEGGDFRVLPVGDPRSRQRVAKHVALNLSSLDGFRSDYRSPAAHGYLMKVTSHGGRYQRRYFVQRGSILLSYVDASWSDPKGVFLLDGATVTKNARLVEREGVGAWLTGASTLATQHTMVLRRPPPSELAWELNAPTDDDIEAWIAAFLATRVVRRMPDEAKASTADTDTDAAGREVGGGDGSGGGDGAAAKSANAGSGAFLGSATEWSAPPSQPSVSSPPPPTAPHDPYTAAENPYGGGEGDETHGAEEGDVPTVTME